MDIKRLHDLGSDLARIAAELAGASSGQDDPGSSALPIGKIRDVLRSRRLRERLLPEGLFADPALDMLLELTVRQADGTTISITGLCKSVGLAQTTGLRWIVELEARGLVERAHNPADRRKADLRLTDTGTRAIISYVTAAKQAGLPLA